MAHVFAGVSFFLPISIPPERAEQLRCALHDGGGVEADDLTEATHVISNTDRFEGWHQVSATTAVVTELWVERCVHFEKPQPAAIYSADPTMIFSGVTACAAEDVPENDKEVLMVGITSLGGCWRTNLSKDATHCFAITRSSPMYSVGMHHHNETGVKVILPHWFDDCMRIGRGSVELDRYQWPDPPLLKTPGTCDPPKRSQNVDSLKKALFKTAAADVDYDLSKTVRRPIWGQRRLLLSRNLGITPERKGAIESAVENSGGIVIRFQDDADEKDEVEAVDDCDYFITKHRSGKAYFKAARARKTIGNLNWLFHVISSGTISRPADELLHYPTSKKPIDTFHTQLISISNYTGEGRDYLRKLIEAMGARFTPNMSSNNTVLVAAFLDGTKTQKARSWSIPVVNHLWLEDCFTQWRPVTVALDKYINFPENMNFSRHLAEKGVPRALEDLDELDKQEADDEQYLASLYSAAASHAAVMVTPWKDADDDMEVGATSALREADDEDRATASGRQSLRTPKTPLTKARNISADKATPSRVQVDSPDATTERSGSGTRAKKRKRATDPDEDEDVNPASTLMEPEIPMEDPEMPVAGPSKPKQKPSRPSRKSTKSKDIGDDVGDVSEPDTPMVEMEDVAVSTAKSPRAPRKAFRRSGRRSDPKPMGDVINLDSDVSMDERPTESNRNQHSHPQEPILPPRDAILTPKRVPSVLIQVTPKSTSVKARTNGTPLQPAASIHLTADERKATPRTATSKEHPQSTATAASSTKAKRSAATKATQRLHDEIMPDVLKHQQELKNKSRRSIGTDISNQKKRTASAHDDGDNESSIRITKKSRLSATGKGKQKAESVSEDEEDEQLTKRSTAKQPRKSNGTVIEVESDVEPTSKAKPTKTSKSQKGRKSTVKEPDSESDAEPASTAKVSKRVPKTQNGTLSSPSKASGKPPRIMTTQVTLSDNVSKQLAILGAKTTTRPSDCTHLIVPRIIRTEKFLCALAAIPWIVTEEWATESVKAAKLLQNENEAKYDFTLDESLARAKESQGRLFRNTLFYITSKVPVDFKLLKNVVVAFGGEVTKSTPTLRTLAPKDNKMDKTRYVISCPEDSAIWKPLAREYPIYTQELILTGALKQKIESDKFRLATDD
ncbi:hypothetical protein BDZ89DRAFT_1057049 [Hymenopellis radicata]|nr:hypothetical protein BDZ89DRAFT_1057049 [Hymenopellis radicata]